MLASFSYLISYVVVQHAYNRGAFAVWYGIKDFIYFWGVSYINLPNTPTHSHISSSYIKAWNEIAVTDTWV